MDENLEEFGKSLEWAFSECQGDSAFSLHRNRDYNGQPHTDNGTRGKQLVEGLTMRDIKDCMVRAFIDCASHQDQIKDIKEPITDDLYKIDGNDIDPVAILQTTCCWIEKYMGIFPNVPKLDIED